MLGDGVNEPYQLVLVEPVAEPEVVVREELVTLVIPLAPLEEEREIIIISSDEEEEGEGLGAQLARNYACWIADGNPPGGRYSSPEAGLSQVRESSWPPSSHSLSPGPPRF